VGSTGRVVGRYVLYDEIASGGMATIHLGRLIGQVGFARTVAIKRLHPHFAKDPEFVAMFIDEARLAAGVQHPNVVSTLDIVALEGELFLVMEYVEGDSFSHLMRIASRQKKLLPPGVVSSVVSHLLYGLHSAHVAKDERGVPLHIVHRDVSPQNVLVGVDGVARVLDFGVAKAARRIMETEAGRLKGKFRYMAPEQIRHDSFDHRVDIFAAGVVLWEALTGKGLFVADEPMRTMTLVVESEIPAPSSIVPGLSEEIDRVVARALERDPERRYQTARELAVALETALPPAVPRVVGELVEELSGDVLQRRAKRMVEIGSEPMAQAMAEESSSAPRPSIPVIAPELDSEPPTEMYQTPPPTEQPVPPPAANASSPFASSPVASSPEASNPVASSAPLVGEPVAPSVLKEPNSQVSEVSTAAWDTAAQRSLFPPQGKRLARGMVAIAAASVSILVLLSVVLLIRSSKGGDETGVPEAPVDQPPPRAAVLRPLPTPEPVPTPSAVEPEESAPPPSPPPPSASAPPAAKPPATHKAAVPHPAAPVAPKPKAGDCNPPYTIENGIKKFKRWCM
jgi:eukaryotic-like serine/threonine-protein kinase